MTLMTLPVLPVLAAALVVVWVLAMDLLIRTWEGTPKLAGWWFRRAPLVRCLLALFWPVTLIPLAIAWSMEARQ